MTDPTRPHPRLFYITAFFLAVTVLSFLFFVHKIDAESKARTHQLQDVICGVYVPISGIALMPKSTAPLKTIVLATRHGALVIHCPGAK